MLSLLIFLAFSWVQILEPVRSLHVHSNQLFASGHENALLSNAYLGTDQLELFQRGLDDQKGKNAEQIPAVDAKKAIASIGRIQPVMLKPAVVALSKLMSIFGESLVSELFDHIRSLIRNPNAIKQYPRMGLPSSDAFNSEFTREALLVAVGELPDESIAKSMPFLQKLKATFKGKEMEALFTNIMKLLENQPNLKKYSQLAENVDTAFELDKPLDIASLGLPVPTKENPVVYFQLVDDDNPSIKFLVKMKLEDDRIVQSTLIKTGENGSSMSSQNSITSSEDEGIEELYRKLPISKLVKH